MEQTTEEMVAEVTRTHKEIIARDSMWFYPLLPMMFSKGRSIGGLLPIWSVKKAPEFKPAKGEAKWSQAYTKASELLGKWFEAEQNALPKMIVHLPFYDIQLSYEIAHTLIHDSVLASLLANGWDIEVI